MIGVDRPTPPTSLESNCLKWTDQLCKARRKFHLASPQAPFVHEAPKAPKPAKTKYASPAIRRALDQAFHGKCAYCETHHGPGHRNQIDHFRPSSIYPSLAYQWNNLLPACPECNCVYKRDRFPLQPDGRQPVEDKLQPCSDRSGELNFLVDPCRDHPGLHFSFYFYESANGAFEATIVAKDERATHSIDVYGLTRETPVDAWRSYARDLYVHVQSYRNASANGDQNQVDLHIRVLKRAVQPESEYSAMARAFIVGYCKLDVS